jgi:DNA-binding transcriptional LysR family regulator
VRQPKAGAITRSVLWPRLEKFLREYADIKVELITDYKLSDIVAKRYDAGVRFGEHVAKDMIAVRIGPEVSFAIARAPSYFAGCSLPMIPQDLLEHTCINLRLPTYGGLYA